MLWYRMCYVPLPKNASVEILCAFCDNGAPAIVLGLKNLLRLHPKISFCAKQNAHHFNPIYILRSIYITRFKVPLQDVPRGVAQERIEKHTACDWYHMHMISYYDVLKCMCCSIYLWQHACITQQQRPAGPLIAGPDNKSNQLPGIK